MDAREPSYLNCPWGRFQLMFIDFFLPWPPSFNRSTVRIIHIIIRVYPYKDLNI